MAFIYFIAGIKPGNWKPWKYFYADKTVRVFNEYKNDHDTDKFYI